ncbi:MAG TPA: FtsX-like permease family protein [Gemmatimonadetes bacterium]|nr:FtsX-like permease family protein [Gemmatimonadota bacterium]
MPRGALRPGWGLRAVDMWRPFGDDDARASRPAIGVLRTGVGADQANERLIALAEGPDGLGSAGYASLVAERVSDGIGGYLGLLMAAVGLYGVVSQVVGQRTREIGIRMALGARQASIASMVPRRAGGATLVGIVGGVGLAMVGTRLLESRIVDVEASPLGTFLLVALALGLTALLAAYAPARRATRVDPVAAMRTE